MDFDHWRPINDAHFYTGIHTEMVTLFFVCLALLMDVTCSWSKKCMTSNQTGFVGSCTWRSRDDRDSRLNLNEN